MTSSHQPLSVEPALLCRLEWARREQLREALRSYPLVHVRAPTLRPSEFIALGHRLGEVDEEPRRSLRLPGHPQILVVGNVRDDGGRVVGASALAHGIHSDRSYRRRPPAFTMLYALSVPSRGGDTQFWSLYRLYAERDAETRRAWRTLEVEHDTDSSYFAASPDRGTRHPLVTRHPDTGRWVVSASPNYARRVIGLSDEESDAILQRITTALDRPDAVHHWSPNDVLVWDNRAVVHRATPYEARERRELWRLSISLAPAQDGRLP